MKLGFRCIASQCTRFGLVRPAYPQDPDRRGPRRCYAAKLDKSLRWDLDQDVKPAESSRIELAKLPGNVRLGARDLPVELTIAINRVLMQFNPQTLRKDALELRNRLVNRKPPAKIGELKKRAKELERQILAQDDGKRVRSRMSHEEVISLEKKVQEEVFPKLRSEFHNWKPLDYSPYVCAQYLVNRFPEEYGVLTKIFSEIRHRVPDFAPKSLLDFGSGVATVSFAAKAAFEASMKEYYCVDVSPDMNNTAKEIVNNGTDGEEPLLSKAYFRQHFPASRDRKYDLVVSAYSLLELPTTSDRLKTLRSLWQKTERFLVLVELGNISGYQLIMEARDHLLGLDRVGKTKRKRERLDEDLPEGRVFAPCPHDFACPRQAEASAGGVICHFPISFQALPFMSVRNTPWLTSRYSYIVLEKTTAPRTEEQQWPRVVENVLKKHHHVICRMCCADGNLQELVATKEKHTGLYSVLRQGHWGDQIPLTTAPKTEEELQEDLNVATARRLRMTQRAELRSQVGSSDNHDQFVENEDDENDQMEEIPNDFSDK